MSGYDVIYDVIVCGGGTSGVAAAVSAARAGAEKVLLVERTGSLGGQMSVSGPPGFAYARLFNCYGEQDTAGFVEETHQRLYKAGHALPHLRPPHRVPAAYTFSYVDPEWWTLLMFQMMEENHVTLLLDTMVVGVTKDNDTVTGIVVEAVDGRHEIKGKIVIDSSGEGYVAAQAGCEMVCVSRDEMQPHTICFTADGVDWDKVMEYIRKHPDQFTYAQLLHRTSDQTKEDVYNAYQNLVDIKEMGEIMGFFQLRDVALQNGDWHPFSGAGFFLQPKEGGRILAHFQHSTQVDHCLPTDAWDLTRCHIECRKQIQVAWRFFKNYVPGFENAYIVKMGTELRLREGPRIVGDYMLVRDDILETRRFPDVIGKSSFPAGAYHTANINSLSSIGNQKIGAEKAQPEGSYDIPYRCMVPQKVENLLAAGKCVSTDRPAYLRYVQQTMVTGQAAGVAAALCVKKGISPRQMEAEENVKELQAALEGQGAIVFKTRTLQDATDHYDYKLWL